MNERNILKTDLTVEKRNRTKLEERTKQLIKKYDQAKKNNLSLEKILKECRDGYRQIQEEQEKEKERGIMRGTTINGSRVAIKGGGGKRGNLTPKTSK